MDISRRNAVQLLAALGVGRAVPDRRRMQDQRKLAGDEAALVQRALQRRLEEFQLVRSFEFADDVGLPTIFRARR